MDDTEAFFVEDCPCGGSHSDVLEWLTQDNFRQKVIEHRWNALLGLVVDGLHRRDRGPT